MTVPCSGLDAEWSYGARDRLALGDHAIHLVIRVSSRVGQEAFRAGDLPESLCCWRRVSAGARKDQWCWVSAAGNPTRSDRTQWDNAEWDEVNGVLRGFVVAALAAAGLLVTVPGAEAAQVTPLGVDVAIPVRSSDGHAELFAQLPTRATGVRPGEVVIVYGYHRTVAGRYGDKLAGSVYGRNLMAAVRSRT